MSHDVQRSTQACSLFSRFASQRHRQTADLWHTWGENFPLSTQSTTQPCSHDPTACASHPGQPFQAMSWRRMDFCDPPHRVAFAKSRTRASATTPCWPPLLHRCRGTLWTRTDSRENDVSATWPMLHKMQSRHSNLC